MDVKAIPIELIRLDGGTQIRDCKTMRTKMDEYLAAMIAGAQFPPLTVFWDGEHYWLADGFHRLGAYNMFMQGMELPGLDIPCEVAEGSRRDAILFACGTNAEHGIQRTVPDKQNAVNTLLGNPLVSLSDDGIPWSDRAIGRICKVHHTTVAKWRAEYLAKSPDSGRQDGAEAHLAKSPDSGERTVTRGGTTYTMKTANIGTKAASPKAEEADARPEAEAPPAPEAPARTAEVVQFTSPHDYLYDVLAEIDRAMKRLPAPCVAAQEFPVTLAHALPTERVVEINHWWLDFARFWAAREPELLHYQRRQLDFITEELNAKASQNRPR